jgi:regulator of sigma E protease
MIDVFLHGISTLSQYLIGFGVPFLFVLTIVVFFHELGHFWVARWSGVKVLAFSLGFGPELVGFNDRHGTRWKISAIPLGGYVKYLGDESAASTPSFDTLSQMSGEERAQSFHGTKVGARAAIAAAGPFANFILSILIFAVLFSLYGKPSTSAQVDSVQPGSAAAIAGFQPGDVVQSINGDAVESFAEMQRIVSVNAGEKLTMTVKRGDSQVTLLATPEMRETKDNFGNTHRQGVLGIGRNTSPTDVMTQPVNPATALWLGVKESWFVVDRTLAFIGGVATGRETADQVGGPIRIAQISGQVATLGLSALMHLTAVLSISIGLLNLFPVPLLDGGHLLFCAIEAVRGRPLSDRAQEMGFRFGLALVLMLMIFTFYNDITTVRFHLPNS